VTHDWLSTSKHCGPSIFCGTMIAVSTVESKPAAHSPDRSRGRCAVLIADSCPPGVVDALEGLGCSVLLQEDLTVKTLPEAIGSFDPDVLVVRSTKVPAAVLEAAPRLSLIVRAGAGYDNIDVATASSRGVFVANCPGRNAVAVAELAWALILACDRRVPDQTVDLRNGIWNKKLYAKARGLHGRTLGIIGLGRIGRAVADRGHAFGMNVIAWSRRLTEKDASEMGLGYRASPLDVARDADVVSINVASTPETKHLVDGAFCAAMKDGASLINTSRGDVIDEDALVEAIRSKGLRAGRDVFAGQPAPTDKSFSNAIVHEAGVYGTHHCGASTDQAQDAIADEVVRIVTEYTTSGTVPNCVNRATLPAACLLTVRHLNRPGVLAHVFQILGDAGINVEEMENIIYDGADAACARVQLSAAPSPGRIDDISRNENILSVALARADA
jgi:D-3-phosphoglycerate dehydrogenase